MLRRFMDGLRSATFRNAIAIPMPHFGEALKRAVTRSKSAMTKSIGKVFRRKSVEACKNHIAKHLRVK
jgi:hypothetical protein